MNYLGRRIPVEDALLKVTGEKEYFDDIRRSDLLYGKILFSPYAHARILSINTEKAEKLPGVRAVITYKNTPNTLYNRITRDLRDPLPATERMFDTILRNVGDEVAAVAAETEDIAKKAIQLIEVEYEKLPVVLDPEEALLDDAVKLYSEGNLLKRIFEQCGNVDVAISNADKLVSGTLETKALHHAAIELHGCIAHWKRDGEVEVWSPQQSPYRLQIMIARYFGIPLSKVKYHCTPIGGSFGGKQALLADLYALQLSRMTGRPVKIRFTRRESMVATYTRHAARLYTHISVKNDGTITGISQEVFLNAGPYCGASLNIMGAMCKKLFKVYGVSNIRFDGKAVYTNALVGGAMRGFGSPLVFTALEVLMDKVAKEIGVDPVELRLKNAVKPYSKDPLTEENLYNARAIDCIKKGSELFEWKRKRLECEQLRKNKDARYLRGVGMAYAMHGNGVAPFAPDITVATMSLHEDGTVVLRTAITDHGAGSNTLMKIIAAEVLQIPPAKILFIHSDTFAGEYDTGASASRNTWTGGEAVRIASDMMREELTELAAEMLGVSKGKVKLKNGIYSSKDKSVSMREIAWYAMSSKGRKVIVSHCHSSPHNAGSYGAHFAHVQVDKQTGQVKVLDYTAVCDVGRALLPMLLEGQIEGAIAMGIGMALFEELELNKDGIPVNANLRKYRVPKAQDMPEEINIAFIEEGEHGGPFGGKSIGEASVVPVAPAIINAVNHALGTELCDLPLTTNKILRALKYV